MDYGLSIFVTDRSIRPDELAVEAERRGFESLWFPEHSHIPTSRETPWGGVEGAPPLPEHYWRTHDLFGALNWAAAATTTLKVTTGVALVAQRDPVWTAKEVATLDRLSGGRLLFGIGYGWNREELATHGVAYRDRREILRENILTMKELWTSEVASFHGTHVHLEESWAWPKPIQQPNPPILLGAAAGPRTIAHLGEFCDGWIPLAGRHDLGGTIEKVRSGVADAGRDPDAFEISAVQAKPEQLADLRAMGVDRAVFGLPSAPTDVVISKMDELATSLGM